MHLFIQTTLRFEVFFSFIDVDNTVSLRLTIQAETVEELRRLVEDLKGESVQSQLQNLSEGLSTYIGEDINVDVVVPYIDARAITTVTNTGIILVLRN